MIGSIVLYQKTFLMIPLNTITIYFGYLNALNFSLGERAHSRYAQIVVWKFMRTVSPMA